MKENHTVNLTLLNCTERNVIAVRQPCESKGAGFNLLSHNMNKAGLLTNSNLLGIFTLSADYQ